MGRLLLRSSSRGTVDSRLTSYATLALFVVAFGLAAFQLIRPVLVWVGWL